MNIYNPSGEDVAEPGRRVYLPDSCSDRVANWIKRLEAATARLEDIASSTVELPQGVPALKETLATPQSGIVNSAPAAAAPPPPPAPAPEPVPESIEEFDAFVNSTVQKYAKLSKDIGGLLAEQVWPA
jgi:adenylyl cyclase-associated protein